jgi:hypothetical protein
VPVLVIVFLFFTQVIVFLTTGFAVGVGVGVGVTTGVGATTGCPSLRISKLTVVTSDAKYVELAAVW